MSTISTDKEQATTHMPGLSTSYNIRQVPVKLDNVDLLVAHGNYNDLAAQVRLMLREICIIDIVLDPVRGNVPSISKVDAEGRDRCTIGI